MTEIRVVIHTYRESCASCHLIQPDADGGYYCFVYKKTLTKKDEDGYYLRRPECIEAEAELARLREIEKEHKQWNEGCNCGDCPLNTWEACDEICSCKMTLIDKIAELAAELKEKTANEPLSWENIPDYGDLMTVSDFRESLVSGCFIESDGCGQYAMSDKCSNKYIDFNLRQFDEDVSKNGFTHVIWFNK